MPGLGGVWREDDVVHRDVRRGLGNEGEGGADGRVRGEGVLEADTLELGRESGRVGAVVGMRVKVGVLVVGGGGHQGCQVQVAQLLLLVESRFIVS